jgi:hypothetical protein
MRQPLLEALFLVIAAFVLGIAYTFVTKQGFFAEAQSIQAAAPSKIDIISLAAAKDIFESHNAFFIDARHEIDRKSVV